MSCIKQTATFRLLDHLVGWDQASTENIVSLNHQSGLRLQQLSSGARVPSEVISPWLPPQNLAFDPCACRWYLVTPCPPKSQLLTIDPCSDCFTAPVPGAADAIKCASGVAVGKDRVAVIDTDLNALLIFTDGGRRQIHSTAISSPGPVAYAPWGAWLVVDTATNRLIEIDLAGLMRQVYPAELPGTVSRIELSPDGDIWLAVDEADIDGLPQVSIWHAAHGDSTFSQKTLDDLQVGLSSKPLRLANRRGFCLSNEYSCGPCFSWYGRPLKEPLEPSSGVQQFANQGQYLSLAIDSGIPRCDWHRVRLDCVIPDNTSVTIAVSTSEHANPIAQGQPSPNWLGFALGLPHPQDWQEPADSKDFLIQQPPGRYLFVRLRLRGDGIQTPRVQRVRLDFPRQTSLNKLPQIFRSTPETEDFSKRFLALFDAFIENVDEQIERLPAILDVLGVPEALIPWLGRFLGIAMDPAWDETRRRRLLQAAPKLYRMRGTTDGISAAIRMVFDIEPVIVERSIERPWGSLGQISLNGGVRLFAPSQWRFTLDKSRLSKASIRGYGASDMDPFTALAYRIDVTVPLLLDSASKQRLEQLIDAQKPAHTIVRLRDTSVRFSAGNGSIVGISTGFHGFKAVVLSGEGGIALGRDAVLSMAKGAVRTGMIVGQNSSVAINRRLE